MKLKPTFCTVSVVLATICVTIIAITSRTFATEYQAGSAEYLSAMALIKENKLDDALVSLQKATLADKSNKNYMQEFLTLRQIVMMQRQLPMQKDNASFVNLALRIRTYLDQRGASLLELDKKLYAKQPTPLYATLLAESYIKDNQPNETVKLYSDNPKLLIAAKYPDAKLIYAIALAKTGKLEESEKIYHSIQSESGQFEADRTNLSYLREARLLAQLGKSDDAIKSLVKGMAKTPPSAQPAMRAKCFEADELSQIGSDSKFKQVFQDALLTKSEVVESACSGGSSCATCPSRANCEGQ